MPYAISVMRALVKEHGMQVSCIWWDERKRTPFVPTDEAGIKFYKRSVFDKTSLFKFIEERDPSIIYVVGRMDKLYLEAALHFKNKSHIVTGCDNQWTGSLKQKMAALFGQILYRRYFEYIWVPGVKQREFARQVGYSEGKIIDHLLTADTAIFGDVYENNGQAKKESYPHTIVYAGRFAKEKGVDTLIAAFTEAKNEMQNDWRLVLVGSGEMPPTNVPFIEVKGFMTGNDLAAACKEWGVFCLPSIYEPWGVVIHEFTMAGLPIICSDNVGAAADLVQHGVNGYIFKSGDKDDLKKTIRTIMAKDDEALNAMAEKSHELSRINSPSIAAATLLNAVGF
jgi:glycosyltransferase involved in cell wall biosynthesis